MKEIFLILPQLDVHEIADVKVIDLDSFVIISRIKQSLKEKFWIKTKSYTSFFNRKFTVIFSWKIRLLIFLF